MKLIDEFFRELMNLHELSGTFHFTLTVFIVFFPGLCILGALTSMFLSRMIKKIKARYTILEIRTKILPSAPKVAIRWTLF